MDKVLVHQALTTLEVIVVGLISLSLFEILLTGLRTHVFAHTTSKIDVELGARLFRHLLALPLAYFESRRVGDTIARVRELENIRHFLIGIGLALHRCLFIRDVLVQRLANPDCSVVIANLCTDLNVHHPRTPKTSGRKTCARRRQLGIFSRDSQRYWHGQSDGRRPTCHAHLGQPTRRLRGSQLWCHQDCDIRPTKCSTGAKTHQRRRIVLGCQAGD